jgi:serine/threonine protein kinase
VATPEEARNAAEPLEGPTAFGRYTILGRMGSGGMADALLAMLHGDLGFQKLMVLKRMHASLGGDPHFVKMFLDEARLAARLSHPNVVQTSEVGEVGGQYFIAMEYLDGQSLDRIVRRYLNDGEKMPLPFLLRVLCDALEGLHYAHGLRDFDGTPLGVVHRDVTPSNLFVTYDGAAKVLDFGIAKAAIQDEATRTGMLKGKLAYMSPEQFFAEPLDCRSDVWSMGVVVWELCTGRRLFKATNDVATYKNIMHAKIPPVRSYRDDAWEALDPVIARALERDRRNRYPDADAMRRDLDAILASITRCDRSDVAEEMRRVFGATMEENRRMVREYAQLGTSAGSALGLSSLGVLLPGKNPTIMPTASGLNARSLGLDVRKSQRSMPSFAEPAAVEAPDEDVRDTDKSSGVDLANVPPRGEVTQPSIQLPPEPAVAEPPSAPDPDDEDPEDLAETILVRPSSQTPRVAVNLQPVQPLALPVLPPPVPGLVPAQPGELVSGPFDPVRDAPPPPRKPSRVRAALVSLVGWVLVLSFVGAVALVVYTQRTWMLRALDELVHGRPPDPATIGGFRLRIESDPSHSRVFEGSAELGTTPLELDVHRSTVQARPRLFVLLHEGYRPTTAVQVNTLESTATLRVTLPPVAVPIPPPPTPLREPRRPTPRR